MAEQTFRSPGFFENEIDLTQRTKEIEGVPAGVIGMANKGPAFVPVTVGSFLDFERKFGSLNPDYFGPYAAHEWLVNRTALTYVRVLGAGANADSGDIAVTNLKGTVKNAGFRLVGSKTHDGYADTLGRHAGTVQFIVAAHDAGGTLDCDAGYPLFSHNSSFTPTSEIRLVRAMIMMASGTRLEALNHDEVYPVTSTVSDLATISSYDGTESEGTFKLVLSCNLDPNFGNDEGRSGIRIHTASLDPSSKYYIGGILNTNPERFHTERHVLYGDFAVASELAKVTYHDTQGTVCITSGSGEFSASGGDTGMAFRDIYGSFNTRYKTSKTTAFISQPFGTEEYDLFHFEALDDGVAGNANVKISISNLRRSTDPKNEYGTFTVLVRSFNDTDTDTQILEQYPLCTLNPADDDYIGKKIGDYKVYYNFDAESESERRLNVSGKRSNKSAYVRVVMNSAVEDGEVPSTALPFGFRGLPVIKTTDNLRDDTSTLPMGSDRARLARCAGTKTEVESEDLTYSILPPVPLRFKATRGAMSGAPAFIGAPGTLELADNRYFWGVQFERIPLTGSISNSALAPNASAIPNPIIKAYSRYMGIEELDALVTGSGADAFCDNKFSLAKVAFYNAPSSTITALDTEVTDTFTGSVSDHMREAAYIRNGRLITPQYTITDASRNRLTFASLVSANTETTFNRFTEYMKFTNVLRGGFDGLNALDRDQRLMNDRAASTDTGGKAAGTDDSYMNLSLDSSPGSAKENNAINSYRTAGRIITDELASRVNLVIVPGIRDAYVADYISDLTRDYSKAMYIMDIPAYDDDLNRLYDDSVKRPNVRKTVEQFEGRALDNNYVATYFPDVIIEDVQNNDAVNVPASIAAVAAISYNDTIAYPWFAPAGFNRGALGGVLNTEVRLSAEDRNVMYEARINPIASFPNAGFVIFGQKTLQQARSALDRVNVRRMLLEVKRVVSDVANKIIFEQNTPATRAKFIAQVTPLLATIQMQQGIDQFKVVMDGTNNTDEDIESNRLNGRIVLVPTRAVEFIAIDFIITNSGVSFE